MPYIKLGRRFSESIKDSGELNFHITKMIDKYIIDKGLNYQAINDVIGALEGAKLEFYRRVAAKYENKKIQENGDVYSESLI